MNLLKKSLLVLLLSSIFISCSTTINFQVKRPAEVDLNGANSIAILPFQTNAYGEVVNFLGFFQVIQSNKTSPEKDIAMYMYNKLQQDLLNANYLQLVGATPVQKALESNTQVPCDVYLTGAVSYFDDDIEAIEEKDEEGLINKKFRRRVLATVTYEVIDSRTNIIIYSNLIRIDKVSNSYDSRSEIIGAVELITPNLRSFAESIIHKLQPYYVSKSISLAKDKTKNPEMKVAHNLVKANQFNLALDKYLKIYDVTNNFAAAYNAGCIYHALGYLTEAEEIMTKLVLETGDKKAASVLKDIKSEMKYARILKEQKEKKESAK